jgi:hypothetical protein
MKTRILVAVFVLLAGVRPSDGVMASPAAAPRCKLFAEQPVYNGSINGRGSWSDCPTTARVTVLLRSDKRWWPDSTLASMIGTGSSGSLLTVRACGNSFEPIKAYVEVRFNGQKVQSARAILPC